MGNSSSAAKSWSDYYSIVSPWYWVLQVCVTLYGMGAIAYLVLVQNAHVVDTVFNTLPGGTYYTWRYITFVWYALMLSCTKLLVYPLVNAAILFRSNRGCSIFWFTLLAALVLVDVVVMVGLGTQYGNCNLSGQPNNMCNDPRWCCALEIYSAPSNGCRNTFACTPPVPLSALTPNVDFLWLFWVNFSLLIVDMLILLFFALVFAFCPVWSVAAAAAAYDDEEWSGSSEDDEDNDVPSVDEQPKKGATDVDMRAMSPTRSTTRERKK